MHLFDGIEPPEGEEDAHLLACGCCSIGKDEGSQGLVEVVAKEDECLVLRTCMWQGCLACRRRCLFHLHHMNAALRALAHETVSCAAAPCLGIAQKAGVCGTNLKMLTCRKFIHCLLHLQDRSGTLYAAGIHFNHFHITVVSCICCFVSVFFNVKTFRNGQFGCCRLVGFQSANEVAHILIAVCLKNIRCQITSQSYATEQPYGEVGRYLAHAFAHIVERNVDGSGNGA